MKKDIYHAIITAIAIIIVVLLSILFYIFSAKQVSLNSSNTASVSGSVNYERSKVIVFKSSEVLPDEIKIGNCQINSIAEPFRKDAWRCMVEDSIYDPCFETSQKDILFCQMNPLAPSAFLIKLTKPLPEASLPVEIRDNWAWFVKLKDGTYCSPFTGARPFFGTEPDVEAAYYGCNSQNKDEQVVLLGDLTRSNVWTAKRAIIVKDGENWAIKSVGNVQIDTVWQ